MAQKRKILTVVLLSAGCGASSSRAPAPTSAATRVPTPTIAAAPQAAPAEPVATLQLVATPPAVAPDREQPQEMLVLRADLYDADERALAAHHARFRALCDAHGYPVVGNVANKSMRHDVSSYCADVRAQLAMRTPSDG